MTRYCSCHVYSEPWKKDIKDYIKCQIIEISHKTDSNDLGQMEKDFIEASLDVDDILSRTRAKRPLVLCVCCDLRPAPPATCSAVSATVFYHTMIPLIVPSQPAVHTQFSLTGGLISPAHRPGSG